MISARGCCVSWHVLPSSEDPEKDSGLVLSPMKGGDGPMEWNMCGPKPGVGGGNTMGMAGQWFTTAGGPHVGEAEVVGRAGQQQEEEELLGALEQAQA